MTVLDEPRPPTAQIAPEALNTAQQRLAAAVAALLQPSKVDVDRTASAADDLDAAEDEAHTKAMAALRERHADYQESHGLPGRIDNLRSRDASGMRRTLALIIAREQAHQAAKAARRARQAEMPSLLEQLVDAVQSTQGGGGGTPSVHGWGYGVDAAQLLADIDRTVRPTPARQAPYRQLVPLAAEPKRPTPPRDLARFVRSWAGLAGFWRTTRPHRLLENASVAERWLVQAREVLSPRRRWTAVGECPRCGQATAHVIDNTGEWVRRPALELDLATGWARCLVSTCDGEWPPEKLSFLASLLEQQAEEKRLAAEAAALPLPREHQ